MAYLFLELRENEDFMRTHAEHLHKMRFYSKFGIMFRTAGLVSR
jgi:hypothetical protein